MRWFHKQVVTSAFWLVREFVIEISSPLNFKDTAMLELLMGSLHDTVARYKIRHAGWQKNATASKTKRFPLAKRDFSLFWMSHCVACHPAGQILYHVTASCKGPIELLAFDQGLCRLVKFRYF